MDRKITTSHELQADGSYRIANYDKGPAFSSFLPGIGGLRGVPLWCMYVNRGQAVVSFGVGDKDNAIAEFLPANWAYQQVGIQGFRTFCKVDGKYYEPFQNDQQSPDAGYARSMTIEADRLTIREQNKDIGLDFEIEYFSPVDQPVGSLIRRVTVTNASSQKIKLNMLDGLALILPAGFADFAIKAMRHINEAYASVRLIAGKVPFCSPKVLAHDEAEVIKVEKGNFYAAWLDGGNGIEALEPIVDPDVVFGHGYDLVTPRRFIANHNLARDEQVWENRLPCALVPVDCELEAGQSVKLTAVAGMGSNEKITEQYLASFNDTEHVDQLSDQSRNLIATTTEQCLTVSNHLSLDWYARQNLLDNVLRGGVPVMLPSKDGPTPLPLYSRRHGDLERDYNFFELPPHPLSSGPGNYRDVCQNRRSDIILYPDLLDEEIKMFVYLIQADGYNPLGVEGYRWVLPEEISPQDIRPDCDERPAREFDALLCKPFHPGSLLNWFHTNGIELENELEWLHELLAKCNRKLIASGHEGGYWVDHWTYITDMLETFEAVYPDKVVKMLNGPAEISWFDEGAHVVSRNEKYLLKPYGPVQLHAVVDGSVSETELPAVTIFGKLCALLAIKAVSFDSACCGIEMEAGRPGWNDALNGLPGLFGSSTCEVAELGRMAAWMQQYLADMPDTSFPVEVADLIDEVVNDLKADQYSWDRSALIREAFRQRIRKNVCGKSRVVNKDVLGKLLEGVKGRSLTAIERSKDKQTGLLHTYFMNEPVETAIDEHCKRDSDGTPKLTVKSFKQKPMPLFLEGQVHYLRLISDQEQAREVYGAVRKSPLLDEALQMYKLNECLNDCPAEIGRARTFTRGWFENESIWLHMSYKYLLELLRNDLYEEFFSDAKTMLVPFMDPNVYGRSILENSSFIASSANPDKKAVGRGFIARLSGSTAEFISIWLLLTVGKRLFFMQDNQLCFALNPVLPAEWFTTEDRTITWKGESVEIPAGSFACSLLGSILLVYHNPVDKDTFGTDAASVKKYQIDGGKTFESSCVSGDIAEKIRQRQINRIDVWLS
ncbi:Cellobiose phosphorylase [Anaerohalosphaera lusitana]|uniref:Cellobiose phosphorylase n=1 Tax=Anaerohalosphaera lusitana TaxID=1936003 RepID=A0A1U9NN22_9BACT|nr:hypothetical protein [Anaerohalosphaera lusitana]AQT69128.1 Cellobiose phosphorylase [Anaerohalosphaera lusitana]